MLWLASSLSISDYAYFGQIYAIQQGLASVIGSGFVEAVIGSSFSSRDNKIAIYKNAIYASLPVTFFLSLIFYISLSFSNNNLLADTNLIMVSMLGGCLTGYLIFISKLNRLLEEHISAIVLQHLPILFFFFTGAVGIMRFESVRSFFITGICGMLFISIVLIKQYKRLLFNKEILTKNLMMRITRGTPPYTLVAVLGWISGFGNIFVIGIFLTEYSIAKYTFLYTVTGMMLLVANSFNQTWSPYFYRAASIEKPHTLEQKSSDFYTVGSLLLTVTAASIIILYQASIELLGGTALQYQNSIIEISLLLSSFLIYLPVWHCRNHIYLKSRGRDFLLISIITFIFGLLSNILMIAFFGDIGIYIGCFLLALYQAVLFGLHAQKNWSLKFPIGSILYGVVTVASIVISVIQGHTIFVSSVILMCFMTFALLIFRNSVKRGLKVWLY